MNSSARIRQMIGQGLARDAVTGELASALVQRFHAAGQVPHPMLVHQQVVFLRNFVGRTADLMDGLRAAARRAGVDTQVEPLLEIAERYFFVAADVLPDHLGLVGLVDDAYLCNRLLQAAADSCRATSGASLLSGDLTNENLLVRQLIGEPHASQLDSIVDSAVRARSFADAVAVAAQSRRTLEHTGEPWRDDPGVTADDAAVLSALLAGRKAADSGSTVAGSSGSEWRGPAAEVLSGLQQEFERRSDSGEIQAARQQNLQQILHSLRRMLEHRDPDLDESVGQAQQLRDLMGRMLGGIARPSSQTEPAARGSRRAQVQQHVGAIKVYLASEVMRRGLSEGEHAALMDLYVRCAQATSALDGAGDGMAEIVGLEAETLRNLALDVRGFALRNHLMVIEPIWAAPSGAQNANAVFFAGGAAVRERLEGFCEARGLELNGLPRARRFAETRWEQLLAANVAIFDLTVPAGPVLASVCYELGIALAIGRGVVICADAGARLPFDVHIEPVSIDADDPEAALESGIDAALYQRQFGGGDCSLARTQRQLRARLGASTDPQVRQMLELLGEQAEQDPVLFRARVGSLAGLLGSEAPRIVAAAWPGDYPGEQARCFHVMPFGPAWADSVRACVERGCAGRARYLRGDEMDDPRIIRSIWDEICRATHVVVDITDFNANVALELGIAHTLGRRTLIVAQQGKTIDMLFESIAKLRVHVYSLQDLDGTLGRAIGRFLAS
jgi:uncharacterized membrane protein YkvA (DUF1232 family)